MFESAVCPNIGRRLRKQCPPDWIEVYHSIGQTQIHKNHSTCTGAACFANDSRTSITRPRHTLPECSCPLRGADLRQLQQTLESHDGALIRLDATDEKIEITVEPMVSGIKYFAISHCMADGLCNTERNQLPECQLRRILRSVKSAHSIEKLPRDYPVYVWIDVICLAVRSSPFNGVTTSTFHTLLRVMSNAVAVVVLDTDIAALSQTSSYVERFLRISFSSWGSRLWTLFEAIIARKLLFECRNGVLELVGFFESLPALSTIEEAANWRPLLYAGLGRPREHHRDDGALLERTLKWCRTSVESDSAPLKRAIRALFHSSTIDRHNIGIQHRL